MNTAVIDRTSKMFWADLCMFYYKIEDFEHAVQTARQILDEQPENCTAHLVLGLVHEANGNFEAAMNCYGEILQLHNDDPIAYKRIANVKMKLGMYVEALDDINQSLTLDKKDPEAYVTRGLIYFRHYHDKIEAILNYNDALRLDPKNVSALYYRGYSFLKYGNYNYAKDDLARASVLGNEDAQEMLMKFFPSHEFKTSA